MSPAEKKLSGPIKYLNAHPDDDSTRVDIADKALLLGDTTLFLDIIKPIALDISDSELRKKLIHITNVTGELELARSLLQREIVLIGRRAGLLTRQKQIDDRIKNAREAAENGESALKRRDWSEAFQSFRAARQFHEGHREYDAKLKLAQAELILKNKGKKGSKEALSFVDKAKEISPDLALSYWIEGDILLSIGKTKAAKKAFSNSLEMGIKHPYATQAKTIKNSKE